MSMRWTVPCSLAVAILSTVGVGGSAHGQTTGEQASTVDDVMVFGRRLEEAVQQYVERVAAPARTRGIARWDGDVCAETVNFRDDLGDEIRGRIHEVASALGLEAAADGCDPNILVIGADDGAAMADAMVDRFRSRFFRFGYTRSNRGSGALADFSTSDAAVRWWHVSLPVHAVTGEPMVRLPGQRWVSLPCYSRSVSVKDLSTAGLGGAQTGARCNAIADRIIGLWIVVDIDALPGISTAQLVDYLAVVALAQVDPAADMSAFDTVLNLFLNPSSVYGLTEWDEVYLRALYSGRKERLDAAEQAGRMLEVLSTDRLTH